MWRGQGRTKMLEARWQAQGRCPGGVHMISNCPVKSLMLVKFGDVYGKLEYATRMLEAFILCCFKHG